MTEWRGPTPEPELIVARIFLGDCWVERELRQLRPGEVVRLVAPDGSLIHPHNQTRDADCVSVVTDWPRKCRGVNGERDCGWGVQVDVYDNLDHVREAGFI